MASASHATVRGRRVRLSMIAGLPVLGLQVGGGLFLVTFAWRAFGSDGFGLWAAITALAPVVALGDVGVGSALISLVASAMGREDGVAARRAVATAIGLSAVAALLLAGMSILAYGWVDWAAWFKQAPDSAYAPGLALIAYVACRLTLLPLGVVNKLRTGLQENFVNSAWDAVGVLISLLLFYVSWRAGAGLPLLLLASGVGPVLAAIGNWIGLAGRDVIPRLREFDVALVLPQLRLGLLFLVLSLATLLSSAADNLVAIRLLGPTATAQVALANKVFTVGQAILSVAMMPLWPAFADAIARRDEHWIRRTLGFGVLASFGAGVALAGFFLFGTNRAVELWLGSDALLPVGLLWSNATWLVLQAVGMIAAMFLNGANVMRFQVVAALGFGVLAFALKLVAAPILGAAGIVWATVAAYAVVLPFYVWFIRRWLAKKDWR